MNKKHIALCPDENYAIHTLVTIHSVISHNPSKQFKFHIIHNNLRSRTKEQFQRFAKIHKLDLVMSDESKLLRNIFKKSGHISEAAYLKLFLPKILKDDTDKVLFIDSDMICTGNIQRLWSVSSDTAVAAVLNPLFSRHQQLRMSPDSKYFNSGLMMINIPNWERLQITAKALRFVQNHPQSIKYAEQDPLNAVLNGRWKELHYSFNMQTGMLGLPIKALDVSADQLKKAKLKPIFIHFSGSSKPWHWENNHPYKNLYWTHASQLGIKIERPTIKNLSLKQLLKKFVSLQMEYTILHYLNQIKLLRQ